MLAHAMVLVPSTLTFQFGINPPRDFHPLIPLTVLHPSKMMFVDQTLSRQLFGWTELRYYFLLEVGTVRMCRDETNDK